MANDVRIRYSSQFDSSGIEKYINDVNKQLEKVNLTKQVEKEMRYLVEETEKTMQKVLTFDFSKGDTAGYGRLVAELDLAVNTIRKRLTGLKESDFKVPVDSNELKKAQEEVNKLAKQIDLLDKRISGILQKQVEELSFSKEIKETVQNVDDLKNVLTGIGSLDENIMRDVMGDFSFDQYGDYATHLEEIKEGFQALQSLTKSGIVSKESIGVALKDIDGFIDELSKSNKGIRTGADELKASLETVDKAFEIVYGDRANYKTPSGGARATGRLGKAEEVLTRLDETLKEESKKITDSVSKLDTIYQEKEDLVRTHKENMNELMRLKEGPGDLEVIEEQKKGLSELASNFSSVRESTESAKNSVVDFSVATSRAVSEEASQKVSKMALQWFGVHKAYQLVMKVTKQMINTYKELDRQITSIAMVSGEDIGESWKNISTYNKLARELGVTTGDVAQQVEEFARQGRTHEETLALIESTTKMGAIANMSYADSVNFMTATINGFGIAAEESMRVSDVFSKLDASAAVSVNELAIALSKTSSIASSAGMSFEYTTAALTTMIETTREAPENLGTAMKSIIARMQEMKESPLRIMEDGSDVNKVETALRSANVELRDTVGEFRDLDDVLIDLGGKWDGLSRGTQRYIATVVAGNRMQSRFLALMENHEKTMEFKDMAEDSEGMSTVSFTKYLDSLEAAFNRLKSAVEGFFTATNFSGVIKDAVNALADLVQGMSDAGFIATALGVTAVFVISRVISKFVAASLEYRTAQKNINKERDKSIQKIKEEITATSKLTAIQKDARLSQMAGETGRGDSLVAGASSVMGTVKSGVIGGLKTILPTIASIGLSVVGGMIVKWVIGLLGKAEREAREFADKLAKLEAQSIESERDYKQVDGLVKEYEELKLIEQATGLTVEQKEKLASVQKQLADNFPELIKLYDAEGQAIFRSSEEIREYLLLKREEALLHERELIDTRIEGHQKETDAIYGKIKAKEKDIALIESDSGYKTSIDTINPYMVGSAGAKINQETAERIEALYTEFATENRLEQETLVDFIANSSYDEQREFADMLESATKDSVLGHEKELKDALDELTVLLTSAQAERDEILSDRITNDVKQLILGREKSGEIFSKTTKEAMELVLKGMTQDYAETHWGEGSIDEIFSDDKKERERALTKLDSITTLFLRERAGEQDLRLDDSLAKIYLEAMQKQDEASFEELTRLLEKLEKASAPSAYIKDVEQAVEKSQERFRSDKTDLAKFLTIDEKELDDFSHNQLQVVKKKTENLSTDVREEVFNAYKRAFALTSGQKSEIQEELEKSLMGMDFSNPLSVAQTLADFQNTIGDSGELTNVFSVFSASATHMEMDLEDLNSQMEHYYNTLGKIGDLREDIAKGTLAFEDVKALQAIDPTLEFLSNANGEYQLLNSNAQKLIEAQKGNNREMLESLKLITQRQIFEAQLQGEVKQAKALQNNLVLINQELEGMKRDSLAIAFEGIEDVIVSLDTVGSALSEQADNGMLGFSTALELIREGYHDLLNIQDGVATITVENANLLIKAKEQEAKASIQAEQDMIAATIAGIDAEIAVVEARLKIAEKADEEGLKGHTEYLKTIDEMNGIGLENEQAVLEDGVVSLELTNGEKAKVDEKYFKWLGGATEQIQKESLEIITKRMQGEIDVLESGISVWENYHNAVKGDSFVKGGKATTSIEIGSFSDVGAYKNEADKARADIAELFNQLGESEGTEKYAEKLAKVAYDNVVAGNKEKLEELYSTREGLDSLFDKLEGIKGFNFEELVMTGGKGGSSSATKELKEYQTKLEETYNILRQIQLIQEQISIMELARDLETNGFRIQASVEKQLSLMEKEIGYHTKATALQENLMADYRKQLLEQYSQFVNFTKGFLEIDVSAVKKSSTGKMTDEQIEYIKTFEELVDKYNNAEDAANDYNKTVLSLRKSMQELRRERIEQVIDMENRLLQALIRRDELELERQKEKLQKMKDADISYLESVRRMREKEKQLRENEKDLEGLSKKRQRLALLERDTSGAYVREIAELKAEIAEEEEALSQDRIDQIIADLEDETNRRGDELDKQIKDLEKAHEEKLKDMSIYWEEVEAIMQAGTDAMLETLMEYDSEFQTMSNRQKDLWIDDMTTAAQEVEAILRGIMDMRDELDNNSVDVSPNRPSSRPPSGGSGGRGSNDSGGVGSVKSFSGQIYGTAQDASRGQNGVRPLYGSGPYTIIGESGEAYRVRYKGLNSGTTGWYPKARAYKEGGLVDYTGPAWVDGTKGKPEAFLSAEDTKNFMELARTLKAMNNKEVSENAGGGNTTIQIDVKVEEGSGLTEDGLIKAVKRDIVNDPVMKTLTTVRRR